MKIGLVAYHSASNFGATLQLLSSFLYWKNTGNVPVVINWVPKDLEDFYNRSTPKAQLANQSKLRKEIWKETELCRTAEDVAKIIKKEDIEAVVIGSDAVAQYHPVAERIIFPTKHLFDIVKYTSDRMFPNVFWGTFNDYLPQPIPVAVISASSQDSDYKHFPKRISSEMSEAIRKYSYISVRDSWTRDMIVSVTQGEVTPDITPDPVFAFNVNAQSVIPSREDVLTRFNLPDKYILLSFQKQYNVPQTWVDEFSALADKRGLATVVMPFSQYPSSGSAKYVIPYPLSPIDWFALIKYSCGYVGNNMHPIVVALHNAVPFFSFDNYGIVRFRGHWKSDKSSKILHILKKSDFAGNRKMCLSPDFVPPPASEVLDKLLYFDKEKAASFSKSYLEQYMRMMSEVKKSIGL